jgi:putative endonuclease
MRDRSYFVYIMASRSRVLYIGITNSIRRRNAEHKERKADSFTAQHRCTRLVLYEIYCSPSRAIAREKQLKGWTRAKKIALIEQTNPQWNDLSQDWEANGHPDRSAGENLTSDASSRPARSGRTPRSKMMRPRPNFGAEGNRSRSGRPNLKRCAIAADTSAQLDPIPCPVSSD